MMGSAHSCKYYSLFAPDLGYRATVLAPTALSAGFHAAARAQHRCYTAKICASAGAVLSLRCRSVGVALPAR
jgi:hypothetical protein